MRYLRLVREWRIKYGSLEGAPELPDWANDEGKDELDNEDYNDDEGY